MQEFCYKCGKLREEDTQFVNNLCQGCFIELHPLIKFPQPLTLKLCKKCNRYNFKNRWVSSQFTDLEAIIVDILKEIIPLQIDYPPQTEIEIIPKVLGNLPSILQRNLILIDIKALGSSHKSFDRYNEVYTDQKVRLNYVICPSCLSLKHGEYQAVVHIIAPRREILEAERDYIFSIVEFESEKSIKTDLFSYISKFTLKKGKISFYIGSENFARSLASIISHNLGGFVKETYKFGVRKIPKEIKRNKLYISLYLPSFVPGDTLLINSVPIYIDKIQDKWATGINLLNHEKYKSPLKNLKKPEILFHRSDLRSFMYFSKIKNNIQLMDLINYQIYEISDISKELEFEVGKTVKGFEFNGRIFLIPN